MLLGNKIDLETERQVDRTSAEAFASNQNLMFWEVSAKTNKDNCVNKAINKLIQEVFDKVELEYDSVSENHQMSVNNSYKIKKEGEEDEKKCC